jgi:F0F1-type ATP synthase membrane subunit a
MLSFIMSWLAWLGLALLVTIVAAVTGIKPKGTRHVAHTRLMGGARLALLAIVIILVSLAYRARG